MMDCVRAMKANSMEETLVSEFHMKVPFRVDPDNKKVTYTQLRRTGTLVAHVDIAEQQRMLLNVALAW